MPQRSRTAAAVLSTLTLVLLALAIFLTPGCGMLGKGAAPPGSGVVVASLVIDDDGDASTKPPAIIRFDGNTLVWWGELELLGEVFLPTSGIPIFGPTTKAKQQVVVKVHQPPFLWTGTMLDPLPPEALVDFRASEIADWHLASVSDPSAPSP